jgi:hypothetical protein
VCNKGYEGDGKTCTDFDECSSSPCDPVTEFSTPEFNMFKCTDCPDGYSGNGADEGGCVDMNECDPMGDGDWTDEECAAQFDPSVPDLEADCTKLDGCKFDETTLTCVSGNHGDSPCDPLTACFTPKPGVYSCSDCPKGYVGNGMDSGGCQELNPCSADLENDCAPESVCDDTGPGQHECWCNHGYEGPGKISEGGCVDINECDPNGDGTENPCDPLTTCSQPEIGEYKCSECPEGYEGNPVVIHPMSGAKLPGCQPKA